MKNKKRIIIILVLTIVFICAGIVVSVFIKQHNLNAQKSGEYYCPMHPGYVSDKPGNCSICGMNLVKKDAAKEMPKGSKKIKYYRNPMNPEVTSPVAMKDPMGMDYVAVYEDEAADLQGGVYINSEKQQAVGMVTENVLKRRLVKDIQTVGVVAYNPELYVAQEEYLQALHAQDATKKSVLSSITQQSASLVEAAQKKLLLLGMTKNEIAELAKKSKADEKLYLPQEEDKAWAYITIYEYESGAIKEGLPVEITAVSAPGEVFTGKIVSLTPVLDSMSRSIQARVEVDDPNHKLKPQMYLDAKIKIDLGEKLSVSQEAVINTGEKTIVVVSDGKSHFTSRDVSLGELAGGFYEVLGGLEDGQIVVTSGNFLIDSESRLQSAVSGAAHDHGK